jgi:hypothetical protein
MVTNQIIVATFRSNRSSGVNSDLVGLLFFLTFFYFFVYLTLGVLLTDLIKACITLIDGTVL